MLWALRNHLDTICLQYSPLALRMVNLSLASLWSVLSGGGYYIVLLDKAEQTSGIQICARGKDNNKVIMLIGASSWEKAHP